MKIGYLIIALLITAINANAQESNVNYEEIESKVELFIRNLEQNNTKNILKLLEYSSIKEKEHKAELKDIIQKLELHEGGKLTYRIEVSSTLSNGIENVSVNCDLKYDNKEVGNLYFKYILKSGETIFLENFYFTSKKNRTSYCGTK